MTLRIAGTGCSLLDVLYADIDFSARNFKEYLSKKDGDGGLTPGKLVFTEEFEQFCGKAFGNVLKSMTGSRGSAARNLGGPAIVALINAAQLLSGRDVKVDFFGARGDDELGSSIMSILARTPVGTGAYGIKPGVTPSTTVLSDPDYHEGHGERIFINNIGSAWNFYPSDLPEAFFDGDIVMFGGTGLVPRIHDNLTSLTGKAKERGRITVVTTVYDFRNEKKNPGGRWPLGESEETFTYTDLFIADYEEALKISGRKDIESAADYYLRKGTGAFILTHGPEDIYVYSSGSVFGKFGPKKLPVSAAIKAELKNNPERKGDTTGCGDNFAGGVIASLASQLLAADGVPGNLDITAACAWGVASGGFAAFYVGGTYVEETPGEKYARLKSYIRDYADQTGILVSTEL